MKPNRDILHTLFFLIADVACNIFNDNPLSRDVSGCQSSFGNPYKNKCNKRQLLLHINTRIRRINPRRPSIYTEPESDSLAQAQKYPRPPSSRFKTVTNSHITAAGPKDRRELSLELLTI